MEGRSQKTGSELNYERDYNLLRTNGNKYNEEHTVARGFLRDLFNTASSCGIDTACLVQTLYKNAYPILDNYKDKISKNEFDFRNFVVDLVACDEVQGLFNEKGYKIKTNDDYSLPSIEEARTLIAEDCPLFFTDYSKFYLEKHCLHNGTYPSEEEVKKDFSTGKHKTLKERAQEFTDEELEKIIPRIFVRVPSIAVEHLEKKLC